MKKLAGILILSTGVVFLLANTGLIDTDVANLFSTFWPAVIIFLGLKFIFDGIIYFFHGLKRDRWHIGKILWGLVVTAAGGILFGNNAGWFQYNLGDLWSWTWPLLIVYLGFKVLFDREPSVVIDFDSDEFKKMKKGKQRKASFRDDSADTPPEPPHPKKHRSFKTGNKNHWTFIGDISLGQQPWEPDGTNVSMGVGSIELDLTRALLKEGDNIIDVSTWVGSVEIYVPKEMAVQATASVKLGEVALFDDTQSGTGRDAKYVSPDFYEADKRLILNVDVNIGDVEVLTVG